MINSIVTVEPSIEPISLDEAKAQLNISPSFTSDDDFINSCVTAARMWIEMRTGRSLITQTRVQYMDEFPFIRPIEILYGNVQSVTNVKYYDTNDSLQTVDASDYWLHVNGHVPVLVVKNSWPGTSERPAAVEITSVNGYGNAGTDVPEPLKKAIKLLVSHLYQNRTPEVEGVSLGKLEFNIEQWISHYVLTQYTGYA